ncbi:MAG: DNA polymerase III subunit delta' [Dissulfurispiraceae bacterium]|nr:DNA polymerase III subunit delta' [Dissulfurispiraceae bacterium]
MSLSSIKGQDRALKIIFGMLGRERVPSAMLFAGDSGIGKRTAAINLAKALNCLSPLHTANGPDCCDECSSCISIDAMTHPDVKVISSEANDIRIEQVREVIEMLSMKALSARLRVIIIDNAEDMNIHSSNAFLKTLEEPPEGSMIILVSGAPDSLPDTVRSRCMTVRFYPLSYELLREVAADKINPGSIDAELMLAMGRPGIALSKNFSEELVWFNGMLADMLRNETKASWQDRNEIRQWLDLAMLMVRDHAVAVITGNSVMKSLWKDILPKGLKPDPELLAHLFFLLQSLKSRLDFNLNRSITWNYVSSIMRMHIVRG